MLPQTHEMPELSVIMPAYNEELFLEEAIQSILGQSFSDFQLTIVNDNSTDGTQKIIERFVHSDPRVSCIQNTTNLGPAKSRNLAIDGTNTPFIAFMDADDIAVSTRFEKQLAFLRKNPTIGVCGSWSIVFGDKKAVLSNDVDHEKIKVGFLSHCAVHNPTVMLRRSSLGALRFDEKMMVGEDYSLYSQLIATAKFHNLPEKLMYYRWHQNNISQTRITALHASELAIRSKQLSNLGIRPEDPNLQNYIYTVSLKRRQSQESTIKTIRCGQRLLELNRDLAYFDQKILEKHIHTVLIRTIRNTAKYNRSFLKYLKNESGFFAKMPKVDFVVLFLKSFFN